jgi:hemoglobin/transferrin/lactoferrin receptor protein
MKLLVSIIMLFTHGCIYAQQLTVKNYFTQEPLEGVNIIWKNSAIHTFTNSKGQADISNFVNADSIIISAFRFKEIVISYRQLEEIHFVVNLKEANIILNEVTVSSNRLEQRKVETPNRIEIINMKEAAFQNPQTSADLLGMSGYAFIQKSQLGGGSPMLRGMATNRVLLVVDDVRMNNAIFRSGNVQSVISLDANAMQNAEILFGPGSVMYGSDAVGGVMSFTTLNPKFFESVDKKTMLTGNAMARFSSANTEQTGHVDFNIGMKKLAFVTSITYSKYGDLRAGSNGGVNYFYRPNYVQTIDNKDYMIPNEDSTLQVGSKYSQVNFMHKVRYKPNKFLELNYGLHVSETSKYNRYDRLYIMQTSGPYKNKLRWAEWYYGPQKWQMHRLGVNSSRATKVYDNLRLVGAYQFFEESRFDREFMFREIHMQKENLDAYSLNIDLDKKVSNKMTISYGTEALVNKVHSRASLTGVITHKVDSAATRYPDGSTWQSYGAYVSAKYQLSKKLIFNGGLRYNHFLIHANFDTTFFPFPYTEANMSNGSTSSNLGIVYNPNTSLQLYANVAKAFRAPNIDDMGKVFESVPGYLVVPNPGLKPEKVYNIECGTVKTVGKFLIVDATIYHTWLKDAMVRKNFVFNGDTSIRYLGNKSTIQAIQNVTKIRVYGIQTGFELFYKGFGIKSNLSYQNGKEQSPDSLVYYPLRHAAPTFGSTHVTYKYKKVRCDFYIVYNSKMKYEQLALTERVNASYARDENGKAYVARWQTLNIKAAYYPSQYVTLTLGVENITDKMYRPYSSGINSSGRNLIVSLKARF